MNILLRHPPTSSLLFVVLSIILTTTTHHLVHSQPKFPNPMHGESLPTIGEVIHQVCDKDKNQKVSMDEINTQLNALNALFERVTDDITEESNEYIYQQVFHTFKDAASSIFELLDSNGDKVLSKSELEYVTKFEQSLMKGGGMRDLLRDVFAIVDVNGDDLLSVDELVVGITNDETISKVTIRVHALFPLREDANELEIFVKRAIESINGNEGTVDNKDSTVHGIISWMDDDKDGSISRKEVGKAYNEAGKKFLEVSKTLKQMGPMLVMLSERYPEYTGAGGGRKKTEL